MGIIPTARGVRIAVRQSGNQRSSSDAIGSSPRTHLAPERLPLTLGLGCYDDIPS
jgi:hypothetical protein